jgi:hypothetical protein
MKSLFRVGCVITCLAIADGRRVAHARERQFSVRSDSTLYHVASEIRVESGGADFLSVDAVNRHLYGAGYAVIDIDRNAIVGHLPPRSGHGFALAPELGRALTNAGVIFDLRTLKVQAKLRAIGDASAYDSATQRAFLFSDTTQVVDMARARVAGAVPLGGSPESGVADGDGTVFVNLVASDSMVVIDARRLTIRSRWPLAPCHAPHGLSMDRVHRRLFASCENHLLVVVHADSGRIVSSLPTQGEGDQNAFDPRTGLVFNPNGDTMTIVHEDAPDVYRVAQTVQTPGAGVQAAVDERAHHAFVYERVGNGVRLLVLEP